MRLAHALTLILCLTSLTVADDYVYVKTNGGYLFDAESTARIARELLERKEMVKIISAQSDIISNQSNWTVWNTSQLTTLHNELKSQRKQEMRNRVRAFFRGLASGVSAAAIGAAMLVILL